MHDTEFVARALYFEFHVRRDNQLKWQAFQAAWGTDRLSLMRTACMTCHECKAKAKDLSDVKKEYRGFALLHTGSIRLAGFKVEDSRSVYCGHAHISLGFTAIRGVNGEPPHPSVRLQQQDIGKKLMELSTCRIDTNPDPQDWPEEVEWLPGE